MQKSAYQGLTETQATIINQLIIKLDNQTFLQELDSPDPEFQESTAKTPLLRNSTRCIMVNSEEQICLLHSRARGYFAIPGGGIEPGETLLQALNRETLEETGFTIFNPQPIGKVIENRNDRITTTFFFTATPSQNLGTHYMEDEIEEDYELIWVAPDQALKIFSDYYQNLKNHNFTPYKASFITARNLQAFKYFLASKHLSHLL